MLIHRAKLKDRLVISVSVIMVLMTILLVVDLQLDLGWSGAHMYDKPNDYRENVNARVAFRNLKRKFQSAYYSLSQDGSSSKETFTTEKPPELLVEIEANDKFKDLLQIVLGSSDEMLSKKYNKMIVRVEQPRNSVLLAEVSNMKSAPNGTSLNRFHKQITNAAVYSEETADIIRELLQDMRTLKIKRAVQKNGGTQIKLTITYENGIQALFKPMRLSREQQTLPNHFYFSDYERHNAEIAAFHLDRLLGFRRAMPVVGRVVNISREILANTDKELLRTSFISPANNLCFYGNCTYYCDLNHPICGNPDMLEGSFAAFLPDVLRKTWIHPWQRSYNYRKKAKWETDDKYCDIIKETSPYDQNKRRLLDLIDMAIFDFLMGNMDRHHYETFQHFGNDAIPLHLDHGRGFGKPFHDEMSILAPLTQCCQVDASTLKTLLKFHTGPAPLSELMRNAIEQDPVAPVLWEPHLKALDRRVTIVLSAVRDCLQRTVDEATSNIESSQNDASTD